MQYYPSIGYTKELTMTGLDNQMMTFIHTARKFVDQKQYWIDSPTFRLLDLMLRDFPEFSAPLLAEYVKYTSLSTSNATSLLFCLMAIIFVSIAVSYFIGIFTNHS
jgi:hypothetical protein